ncbi:hypothetical protein Taro_013600, partial [Colocasia esculenta]|nr:hypothetical protein [Colocasia esculenta]
GVRGGGRVRGQVGRARGAGAAWQARERACARGWAGDLGRRAQGAALLLLLVASEFSLFI